MTEAQANSAVLDRLDNLQEIDEVDKQDEAVDAEIIEDTTEVGQAKLPAQTFVVELICNGDQVIKLGMEDPKQAQAQATAIAKAGTYTTEVENGIQVFGVNSTRVTGPYEIKQSDDAANAEEAA